MSRPPSTSAGWEAAARGDDQRPWPWSPCGAEQLAGNVWEWVSDTGEDGWGVVRGGSYLDTRHGLHAARALPADPERATGTTAFASCSTATQGGVDGPGAPDRPLRGVYDP